MAAPAYRQPRSDPEIVGVLIKLRDDAHLTQMEAAHKVGLEGTKSRDSFSAWESGMSIPRVARRPDFLIYLLDSLRLRRDPTRFEQVWNDVMVGQWNWPTVNDTEWTRLFPGRSRARLESPQPAEIRIVEPPRPTFPPNVDSFVGWGSELDQLRATLESSHRLALTGMPGAGKTWLAAYLAIRSRNPDLIFWHEFRLGEDGRTLIWKLAGFLYWRGRKELWQMLQGGGQGDRNRPPLDLLVDYLAEWLPKGGYLLCLDGFQYVDEDPLVDKLLDRLAPALDGGTLSLLLTSQRVPPRRSDVECWPVAGLSCADAGELLARLHAAPPEALLVELHAATEGNPGVLCLAADELRAGKDPRRLIRELGQTGSIERYLANRVDRRLLDAERDVMMAVAVAGSCTRAAVEAVSEAQGVAQTLRSLQDRALLHVMVGDADREYDLHALLRQFYLDAPSAQRRTTLHIRAGEHYEQEREDLRAASHFLQARQLERAALLATPSVWAAANRGKLHIARQVLVGLCADGAATSRWPAVWAALGQVYTLSRETSAARQALEQAYTLQAALPDSPHGREQKAIICRHMGELLKFDAPREALEWLDRGLAAVSDSVADPMAAAAQTLLRPQAAALHVEAGSVYSKLGEFPAAIRELEQGLALLPERTATRAAGLINLGVVYCTQGKRDQGIAYYQQAIEISQELGDILRVLSARHNLGIEMDIAGQWEAASQEHRWALDLAEKLGSRKHRAQITLSLGILETKRGNYGLAGELLATSVAKARELGLQDHVVAGQSSLAQLKLRQNQVAAAAELLVAAESLATELEARDQLPEIWRGRAEVALAAGRMDEALEIIKQSINLAPDLDLDWELGMSQRVLGQILSARGKDPRNAFEESLSLLRDQDPYEAARTEHQWALALLGRGDRAGAKELLVSARAAFLKLGAGRDLAEVEATLGSVS